MFYIRSNTTTKKVIENGVSLEEGMKKVKESKADVSLMYKMPNGRGIKVFLNKSADAYYLSIEGCSSKKTKQIISKSPLLNKIYLDIKEIDLTSDFSGTLCIRESDSEREVARIRGIENIKSVIKDIVIPFDNMRKKEDESKKDIAKEILKGKISARCIEIKNMPDKECVDSNTIVEVEEEVKTEKTGKFISYNVTGVLRLGSKVILSEKICDYKEALSKYNEVKETSNGEYKEICLNGFRSNGSTDVRFKKTFEPEVLSYEYISEFLKDLGERLEFLKILEKDVKAAMSIEDKRYNVGHHIMEVSDMNFEDISFRENILKMKIAADKRRDIKNTELLLSAVSNIFTVPEKILENIESCIEKIRLQKYQGIESYKNKKIEDFVKEYKLDKNTIELSEGKSQRLTIRPLEVEGKMVVYEKHYN